MAAPAGLDNTGCSGLLNDGSAASHGQGSVVIWGKGYERFAGQKDIEASMEIRPSTNFCRCVLDVHFVSPAPVQSPLGVGAQHAAPLQWLAVYL